MEPKPKGEANPQPAVGAAARFVEYVLKRQAEDNGFAAKLRRADNPATEYQSWEILAGFGVDLEKSWQRLPYCTLGAALAKAKPERDGTLGLGAAIAACYEDGAQSDQAKARLRRLLACTSIEELCQILRPVLALIASRGVKLNFSLLLQQLLWFSGQGQERVRTRWAQDFYHRQPEDSTEGADNE
ncbi:CRISPR system Cascade subunit CasB [Allopseudospirillum japonicum]|uniref:CRISPR system Cascade subunit CasB n=1 Tax=Allopseudospirillum japonicum TaxID=64971 RepID=A0A1H6SP91_9GAMM|nr:type I-E CRISPR-associated protein Cse2/CasB [Allopseudospirillum japonicum]SEI65432.1 CRISPR system Cascade subunit CasB [Allopseudospirillum japonicum]